MKISRIEKKWLLLVLFFYISYNIPYIPEYGNSVKTIIHAVLTLVPLWISVYWGLFKIKHMYRKEEEKEKC